jgi:predicted O-linked N-acetylglucosamine transferase (SPINDLY family)
VLKYKSLGDVQTRQDVQARLQRFGVDPARVESRAAEASHVAHLAAYGDIDIALDPFPYNGTTTTCEALWMGTAVVTLAGDRHAARVGASLLTAVGLGKLIGNDVGEYVERACALAGDLRKLAVLRGRMRDRVAQSPLRDELGFVRRLEQAYAQMLLRCGGA